MAGNRDYRILYRVGPDRTVVQCYYVADEWDFVLILTVRDMAEYTGLTRDLFFADQNVRRFSTLVVMDRAKVSLAVPVTDG